MMQLNYLNDFIPKLKTCQIQNYKMQWLIGKQSNEIFQLTNTETLDCI